LPDSWAYSSNTPIIRRIRAAACMWSYTNSSATSFITASNICSWLVIAFISARYKPSASMRTVSPGILKTCFIRHTQPTFAKSSSMGSSIAASFWLIKKICWLESMAFSIAALDFSRATSTCMDILGNIAIPLIGIIGSVSSLIYSPFPPVCAQAAGIVIIKKIRLDV